MAAPSCHTRTWLSSRQPKADSTRIAETVEFTKNAAQLMGDGATWRTLAPGQRADLVVVRGRPDRTIGDTHKIELVIQRGRVLDRKALVFDEASDPGFREATPVSSSN